MHNILNINTSIMGGAARIALALNQELNNTTGFSGRLFYGRGNEFNNNYLYRFSLAPEIIFHALITRLTGIEGKGTLFSTKRLIKYIEKNKIDLVHLHNIHGYYLDFLLFTDYLKRKSIPVVWTLHDCWSFTGSCAYLFDCKKYLTGCGRCPNIKTYPRNYIDNSAHMWRVKKRIFSEGWQPVIVTPSKWLADIAKTSYLGEHRIEVIPNGIDVDIFRPYDKESARLELGIPADGRVILFIAADLNDERKGVKYFIEAVQKISDTDNLVIVTAGQKIKEGLPIKVNMHEFGFLSDKNILARLYSAADVFCITSLDEIFGLTVTEAMACGKPVVGFKVGGIPEQVAGDCGILVAPKDVSALAGALQSIIGDGKQKSVYADNCRKRVLDNYTAELMVKRYVKLYTDMLTTNKHS